MGRRHLRRVPVKDSAGNRVILHIDQEVLRAERDSQGFMCNTLGPPTITTSEGHRVIFIDYYTFQIVETGEKLRTITAPPAADADEAN